MINTIKRPIWTAIKGLFTRSKTNTSNQGNSAAGAANSGYVPSAEEFDVIEKFEAREDAYPLPEIDNF